MGEDKEVYKEQGYEEKWYKKYSELIKAISALSVIIVAYAKFIGDYMLFKKAVDYSNYFGIPSSYLFNYDSFVIIGRVILFSFAIFLMTPICYVLFVNNEALINETKTKTISGYSALGTYLFLNLLNLGRFINLNIEHLDFIIAIIYAILAIVLYYVFNKKLKKIYQEKNKVSSNSPEQDKFSIIYMKISVIVSICVILFTVVSFVTYYKASEINMFEVIENSDFKKGYYDFVVNRLDNNKAVVMKGVRTHTFRVTSDDGETTKVNQEKVSIKFKKGEYKIESLEGKKLRYIYFSETEPE